MILQRLIDHVIKFTPLPITFSSLLILIWASHLSRLFLQPGYGSVLIDDKHDIIIIAVTILTVTSYALIGKLYRTLPTCLALSIVSSWTATLPYVAYKLLGLSGRLGPRLGPKLSLAILFYPNVVLLSIVAFNSVAQLAKNYSFLQNSRIRSLVFPTCSFFILAWLLGFVDSIFTSLNFINVFPRCISAKWLSRFTAALSIMAACVECLPQNEKPSPSPSSASTKTKERKKVKKQVRIQGQPGFNHQLLRLVLCALIPGVLFSSVVLMPQCFPGPGIPPYPKDSIPSTMKLINHKESLTGMVSVSEHFISGHWARVLRCDHSILGGIWISPARDFVSQNINDESQPWKEMSPKELDHFIVSNSESIYTSFIVQEAVRLVHRPQVEFGSQKALIIGLGVGTCSSAFSLHGIDVSIAEIDPAVYLFAERFFGLQKPNNVYIEDARAFARRQRFELERNPSANKIDVYDFISHDVFTGGSVAPQLFTVECWDDIKPIMAPNGIIAVNYVGQEDSLATRAVQATLLHSFKSCRSFTDSAPGNGTVKNMVAICSKDKSEITFRQPVDDDYLGSSARKHVLSTFLDKEIPMFSLDQPHSNEEDELLLLRDETVANTFSKWQAESARSHWYAMRKTLGNDSWLYY